MPPRLVVLRGLEPHPILLLTNVATQRGRKHPEWIADICLALWKCQEAYRFIKHSYHLEDVRVRSCIALRNIYDLVHTILYLVSVVVGAKAKLNLIFKRICEKARRFFEVATFLQYAQPTASTACSSARAPYLPSPPPQTLNGQLSCVFTDPIL